MAILKKRRFGGSLILTKHKRVYSSADIIVYRHRWGNWRFNQKKPPQPLKIALGGCLVGVGVISLPLPCGSIFIIGLGRGLMIRGGFDFWRWLSSKKKRLVYLKWRMRLLLGRRLAEW